MTVLVTGANGTLGRLVIAALQRLGVPSRGTGRGARPAGFVGDWRRADLLSRAGLADAVAGIETVIHCASNPLAPDEDMEALDHLIEALRLGGASILYVGIACIEDAAAVLPYYRAKLACEARLGDSGVLYALCRATQFYPFLDRTLDWLGRGPVQLCPPMRLQPVDPAQVAERIADLALGGARGRMPDICGPETLDTDSIVAPWLRLRGYRRLRIPLPAVGVLSAWTKLYAVFDLNCGKTWLQWLRDTYSRPEGGMN